MGFEAFTAVTVMSSPTIFWYVAPCSLIVVLLHLGGTHCSIFRAFRFLGRLIFSTLKLETIWSSETSVNFYQMIRRHIPEDIIIITYFDLITGYPYLVNFTDLHHVTDPNWWQWMLLCNQHSWLQFYKGLHSELLISDFYIVGSTFIFMPWA
jgi:hypothetical protein